MINAEFKKTSACDNVDNTENIFDSSLGLRKLNLYRFKSRNVNYEHLH